MAYQVRTLLRIVVAAFAFLTLVSAAAAEPRTGLCIQASIDESIVLPDGSSHPPGVLKVCLERQFTPVAGLHETSIDGHDIGLFRSRFRSSEGPARDPSPVLVFRRIPDGGLSLLGYAVPGRERTSIYWLDDAEQSRPSRVFGTATADAGDPHEEDAGGIELIAAASL